jgi:hypothetical protein
MPSVEGLGASRAYFFVHAATIALPNASSVLSKSSAIPVATSTSVALSRWMLADGLRARFLAHCVFGLPSK